MLDRLINAAVAMILLILSAPFQLVALLCVFVGDFRNPLFKQVRVGQHQRPFTCYKIRTMPLDTPNVASHEISRSQVTKVGRFLRATKIDELPQLINVIIGDMNFVGPRPCLPSQDELIQTRAALCVFDVRPGITGLAQVNGLDMSRPQELAVMDAKYMNNRTRVMDIKLCIQTVSGAGQGDKTAHDT